jgi:bifunctional non-homologous end joining protein LigD
MLAVGGEPAPPLEGPGLLYEPKYDGIRAIVEVTGGEPATARMWSRNGNEKTGQFPDIIDALRRWGRGVRETVVLDGEVVALRPDGSPAGFQRLQHRINISVPGVQSKKAQLSPAEQPAALYVFDLLRFGDLDVRDRPLAERRAALEQLLAAHPFPDRTLRVSEQVAGSGRAFHERALREGWEGLLVKQARSPYRTGKRSPEWRKLKIEQVDDFVVCGYTQPQGSRARFGALVLGQRASGDEGDLQYVGDVGTGFTQDEIERLWTILQPLSTPVCPLRDAPPALARRARWVAPRLVVQVRYTEMTDEGRLRHPAYLGVREDKSALGPGDGTDPQPRQAPAARAVTGTEVTSRQARKGRPDAGATDGGGTTTHAGAEAPALRTRRAARQRTNRGDASPNRSERRDVSPGELDTSRVVAELTSLEAARKDGRIRLPDGDTLDVTNLHKVFWPAIGRTKGDLLRYYARIAPWLLPVVADRPLVMKRLPNGVTGKAFYQHRAPEPVPPGVRIASLPDDDVPARLVGGSLKTLLYMAQLASISMDPWFSTMSHLDHADQVAIDLDPQPGATFDQILDVARWVHEILDRVQVPGFPKTSGSEGLHIFIPLPPGTPYEAGMLFCQIVATMVASQHPAVATVERLVGRRKDGTVYVDYLQNIQGKTLACAYSARASAFAGVSAPLTWEEVHGRPTPQDFTIDTMPARVAEVGDLWAPLRQGPGADLLSAIERLR